MRRASRIILAGWTVMAACRPLSSGSSSAGFGGAAVDLSKVEEKTAAEVSALATAFEAKLARGLATVPSVTAATATAIAETSYLELVHSSSALSREQGAAMLGKVLEPGKTACGGASCARALGLTQGEINPFLDGMLLVVAANPELAAPERAATRSKLVAALTPAKQSPLAAALSGELAALAGQPAGRLPLHVTRPGTIATTEQLSALGKDFTIAVRAYTSASYAVIRKIEAFTPAELAATRLPPAQLESLKGDVRVINDSLAKLPVVKEPVYRGVKNVTRNQLALYVKKWRSGEPIGLGLRDQPGLASATWDPEVAADFAIGNRFPGVHMDYGVVFELTDHGGVGIEELSHFAREREVLIPSYMEFIIEELRVIEGEFPILKVRLKGRRQTQAAAIGAGLPFARAA